MLWEHGPAPIALKPPQIFLLQAVQGTKDQKLVLRVAVREAVVHARRKARRRE